MLGIVAEGLKGLKAEVVFIGGATIDLFITDPAATGTRETDDVDCIIELVGKAKYYALEEKLRALGFRNRSTKRSRSCAVGSSVESRST